MNPRVEFLTEKLTAYLDRRSIPRNLADRPDARNAELSALVHTLVRYAPRQEYGEWWAKIEVILAENADTRAWPTQSEIKSAAGKLSGSNTKHIADGSEIDPLEVIAGRMNAGELVGDGYIYGKLAVDLVRRGLVSNDRMRQYRSALYFSSKKIYGEGEARRLEAEFVARHEKAEKVPSNTRRHSAPEASPKKLETHDWD